MTKLSIQDLNSDALLDLTPAWQLKGGSTNLTDGVTTNRILGGGSTS